jgi:ABC-type transporter Mla maintaining outer membrane lipid asymmetry ATPase subunit MlaF
MATTYDAAMKQDEQAEGAGAFSVAVQDVHKTFGNLKVLNGVSLGVHRGETLAVLGRSGTGKSVLLRMIVGLETPDLGSVRILGQDIAGFSLDQLGVVRKKRAFCFSTRHSTIRSRWAKTWASLCAITAETCPRQSGATG